MHFRGVLRQLQALLPRNDLPGARQPTPLGLNRYILLFLYALYGSFTAAVCFGWPAMAAIIMRNEGFSELCPKNSVTNEFLSDLRKTSNKVYICDEQDAAVQKLYPLTGACCCAMSACGGALVDWIGPRWTASLGQTLTIIGWLWLAFGGHRSTPYIVGLVFIGLGADTGFLPTMCATRIFPGASGFVITFLGSASTASSAVPLVMLSLMERQGVTLKQAALWYIGVGPCFAVLVAQLLLPSKNFSVDSDTPTMPAMKGNIETVQDKGAAPQNVTAAARAGSHTSSGLRSFWRGSSRYLFTRGRASLLVDSCGKRRSSVAGGAAPKGDEGPEKPQKIQRPKDDRHPKCGSQRESAAADGEEVSKVENQAALAGLHRHATEVSRTAAVGDESETALEKSEQLQMHKEAATQSENVDLSVVLDSTEISSAGTAEAPAASAASAEGECARVATDADEEEKVGGEAGGGRKERHDALWRGDEYVENRSEADSGRCNFLNVRDNVKVSIKSGFLHEAVSRRYLLIVVYYIGVSWAGAFYQQAPRRMFSDRVVWMMEFLQPFGSIPCIILGRLADIFGILKIITVINTFGLLMYALSLLKSNLGGYASVICFSLYVSLFTSQVFIYIEKTLSPFYFGKFIGLTVCIGGLVSFVCNPVYEFVVVNKFKGNAAPVQIAMIVLMCVQYIWIASLFYLAKKVLHPDRAPPSLVDAHGTLAASQKLESLKAAVSSNEDDMSTKAAAE